MDMDGFRAPEKWYQQRVSDLDMYVWLDDIVIVTYGWAN